MIFRAMPRNLLLLGLAAILTGCATGPSITSAPSPDIPPPGQPPVDISEIPEPTPHPEPLSENGNPVSYVVNGKRYHVLLSATEYTQTGIASWYGKKFNGQTTASGEIYNMYELTAAHKTLPLPSYVRVTNLENGRQVIVRVNDRGPFHPNRIIDLSYAAAVQLGMIDEGTARVRIKALTLAGQNVSESANPALYLQAGAFANPANAHDQAAKLESMGIAQVFVTQAGQSSSLYHVRIGPFEDPEALANIRKTLSRAGMASLTLRID